MRKVPYCGMGFGKGNETSPCITKKYHKKKEAILASLSCLFMCIYLHAGKNLAAYI
jgi:hypothetical protein